jgi:xanthine dehydrogenase accessory factor
MTLRSSQSLAVAIVLGCDDIGSTVALALHSSGLSVVLVDEADPAWHRRGMSFADAWYLGTAELDRVGACLCASLKSVPSVLARRMIAATTWSWPTLAAALGPEVLVDARKRRRRGSEILVGRVATTIGIGRDFVAGEDVDAAVDIAPPDADRDAVQGCVVEAARHGRFMTERRIGDAVRAGQIVGGLGNAVVAAPADGVLLGLSARGARIEPGDQLVEVDPRGVAHRCFGVGDRARRIAERVRSVVVRRDPGGRIDAAPAVRPAFPA